MEWVRAWSLTRIDGRNVLAMPTQTDIRLYDSDDFILLSRLVPSGHHSPVAFVRWSAYHGKLASLSAEQILVHAPQRDINQRSSVQFVSICCYRLDGIHRNIRGLSFSRSADELLFCGRDASLGKLDVRAQDVYCEKDLLLWEQEQESCDVAKYSPNACVFATLKRKEMQVKVWRRRRSFVDADESQTVDRVEMLQHSEPVVYFAWKPSTTQWHSPLESDGTKKAQWFEPSRILLTCTASKTVRIWTESATVCFEAVLVFEPTYSIENLRWVISKTRNISDQNVQVVNHVQNTYADWISGVDEKGALRLWKLVGITSKSPKVEETSLQINMDGEDDRHDDDVGKRFGEVCVMAYFSQDYYGMPSKLGIVLQRVDYIMVSFHVSVGEKDHPSQISKKTWYRSHLGYISALSAHPSLPLIASVDTHTLRHDSTATNDILVYWISFSAFAAESRLIPSGVLPCGKDSGKVLCIQWVPTLHFDATPLLLVAFESGVIDVYGRIAQADAAVVSSPRMQAPWQQQHLTCSSSLSSSLCYDEVGGEPVVEYEVTCRKQMKSELDIEYNEKKGILRVVPNSFSKKYLSEAIEGDELVSINNTSVVGKKVKDVLKLIDLMPPDKTLLMRFRADCVQSHLETLGIPACETLQSTTRAPVQPTSSCSGLHTSKYTIEGHASDLCGNFLSLPGKRSLHKIDNKVFAGEISLYGGWRHDLHVQAASKLSLVCICPSYADDGEYVPDSVLIFGIESLPGKLCVWKGVRDGVCQSFQLASLRIQDPVVERKANITSIASERDYRQRAFSGKIFLGHNSLNSLLFVGDAAGNIEHWRCQVTANHIYFTVISSYSVCRNNYTPSSNGHQLHQLPGSFCRRGYAIADRMDNSRQIDDAYNVVAGSVSHIEVDDPNRVAVLQADLPDQLQIFEAESGLGILRPEDCIVSNGRGIILGFSWCNSHVEFNVDALAVRYESATVIYHYDTTLHCWSQVGNDIVSPLPLFDCTRDSSALLIGGGRITGSRLNPPLFQPISNDMPVVIGKWDEPGSLLQKSMDWKATESPQKLPVWHPFVLLTTMFGMHARVGKKDTLLAGDSATYEFSRAFKDATQMLKLLTKVVEDEHSARASAASGILSYTGLMQAHEEATKQNELGHAGMLKSVGRYSTSIHRSNTIDKAENLFAASLSEGSQRNYKIDEVASSPNEDDQRTLDSGEAEALLAAIDSILLGKAHPLQANASVLFASFGEDHLLEMKALISFVDAIQSLGFDLDASAADLGAKRFFSMYLFAKSLRSTVFAHSRSHTSNLHNGESDSISGELQETDLSSERKSYLNVSNLEKLPSSGLLWALHSDAQHFLFEHCIEPRMLWDDIRPLWLGLWIKDVKDLRGVVERAAKVSYMRTRNAMDVCLLYVALGKQKVLSALAHISQSKSNKTLASFLNNDFSEKRWTDAAIKNAYSLLSKKKYEMAASFFLLCNPPRIQDAIRVLSVRLGDLSLALIISRLVESRVDNNRLEDAFASSQAEITPAGTITKQLLKQDIIPLFHRKRDVWLESCALWWLEEFEQACAVLLPQFQDVNVCQDKKLPLSVEKSLVFSMVRATHFYINLTSLTLYFQHLHSSVNSSLLSWAKKKLHQQVFPEASVLLAPVLSGRRRLQLASTADIEHAFSFAAYVCKRNGLSDTALVKMLQARQLINLHARFEVSTIADSSDKLRDAIQAKELVSLSGSVSSPRYDSSLASWRREKDLSCLASPTVVGSPRRTAWSTSRRRMSFIEESCPSYMESHMIGTKCSRRRSRASSLSWSRPLQVEKSIPTVPWMKAQIADIECRRWSSSAFVGKMIGIRVAREMISHFRAELDIWFRHGDDASSPTHGVNSRTTSAQRPHHRVKLHRKFLDELCTPLCEQFQVDRTYVYEAALAVLYPHAYLHIVEICFLLSELGRTPTLRKWVEYISLSMLHSCSTFASCSIAEDVYRDWESLTIQLCYILNLDAQGQIYIPLHVIAYVSVAVRTGVIVLGWARKRSDIVRQAVTSPLYTNSHISLASAGDLCCSLSLFAFEMNLRLLRSMLESSAANERGMRTSQLLEGNLGYTFLGAVAGGQTNDDSISLLSWSGVANSASQSQLKTCKMYTLVLMVSVIRTLCAQATNFLSMYQSVNEGSEEGNVLDIASSLFIPQKLWKPFDKDPLEGLKRWYELIESHLRCEFDYSVKETPCLCGLYGLDSTAFEEAANRKWKRLSDEGDCNDTGKEFIVGDAKDSNKANAECNAIRDHTVPAKFAAENTIGDDVSEDLKALLIQIGMDFEHHSALVNASDDYVLLLMQNAGFGVQTTRRRFRLDPRVYVKSFVLRDAFHWFSRYQIFSCNTEADTNIQIHAFLSRCCKQRKLRLLVTHRGEDTQMFPSSCNHSLRPHEESVSNVSTISGHRHSSQLQVLDAAESSPSDVSSSRSRFLSGVFASEPNDADALPEDLYLQSMMFVDPWEVEAEYNVRRYMHNTQTPLHVELGWDRLSPICLETCDGIADSVFKDPDLAALWKTTGGEGWLVTAITRYEVGGVHSYRTLHQHKKRRLAEQEEPKIPFLVEVYLSSQRNAMFEEAGLPHRFVGVVTVELVEAKDLIPCSWVGKSSDAYVFLTLTSLKDKLCETAEEWSLQTYRSPVGVGGVNPQWSTLDSKYVFRFAIPTHSSHTCRPKSGVYFANSGNTAHNSELDDSRVASQVWNAYIDDQNCTAVDALEKLLPSVYAGPPAMLRCMVYQKNKIWSHQFMGSAEVPLDELTSSNQMDCWLPLEKTVSGLLHVKVFLSFELMCSSMLGQR